MTSMYAFLRSFGGIWGVTVPSVIFNGQVNRFLGQISDSSVRQQLANGNAYGFASTGGVKKLPSAVQSEVLDVYAKALRTVWQVAIALSLAGFLAVLAVKQLDMSRQNETEFGLKEEPTNNALEMEPGKKEDVLRPSNVEAEKIM